MMKQVRRICPYICPFLLLRTVYQNTYERRNKAPSVDLLYTCTYSVIIDQNILTSSILLRRRTLLTERTEAKFFQMFCNACYHEISFSACAFCKSVAYNGGADIVHSLRLFAANVPHLVLPIISWKQGTITFLKPS